jgi:hypothetical protein
MTSPHAALWFNKYENMFVIGVEPNPYNYQRLLDGENGINDYKVVVNESAVKLNNETLCNYIEKGNYFFPIEAAVDNVDNVCKKTFYCTSMLNTGCSSLHKPIDGAAGLNGVTTESEVDVNVISLKMILDEFPWDRIPAIELLKTDTQANDLNVIKSCKEYLKNICFVHSEYYAHSVYEGEKSKNECFAEFDTFMKENNFKCYYNSGTDQNPTCTQCYTCTSTEYETTACTSALPTLEVLYTLHSPLKWGPKPPLVSGNNEPQHVDQRGWSPC